MLKAVLLLLPSMTCLFWLALSPLVRQKKDNAFKALELLLAVFGIALFSEAGMAFSDGKPMMLFFLTKQFSALMVIPASLAYIHSLTSENKHTSFLPAWIALPVSLLFAEFILITISSLEAFTGIISGNDYNHADITARLTHLCSFGIYLGAITVQAVVFISTAVIKLIKEARHIQLHYTIAAIILAVILEITSVRADKSLWLSAILSLMLSLTLFALSYSELFQSKNSTKARAEYNPDTRRPEPAVKERQSENIIADVHQDMADEELLRAKFEDLISSEQLFLKQGTRLSDVATMLNTNRTYVSRLVNNTYNMSFSDYMNTLRIDYAEQYLLHHRDAKQSDIAAACGFPNASAFNNVFKKITGVTPKIWLASNS